MPSFVDMVVLDVLMSKLQITFEGLIHQSTNEASTGDKEKQPKQLFFDGNEDPRALLMNNLVPPLVKMIEAMNKAARAVILAGLKQQEPGGEPITEPVNEQTRQAFDRIMSLCGGKCSQTIVSIMGCRVSKLFPSGLRSRLLDWSEVAQVGFPLQASWRNHPAQDLQPFETYVTMTIKYKIHHRFSMKTIMYHFHREHRGLEV